MISIANRLPNLNKNDPKPHHAHPLSHSTSIILEINNSRSSCAHAVLFSFKLVKKGQEGPTSQLTTHLLEQAPSHPPDEVIHNLLLDELT